LITGQEASRKGQTKRKRGEDTRSKSSAGRVLEWKVGPDPEENMVQAASTLNTFAGLNASSFLEVTNTLNTTKNKVVELETELKGVKEKFTIDVQEDVKAVEGLNSEKMNKSLQAQRDQMNIEFEKWMKIQWDTHRNELEVEKKKLNTTLEKTRASTCTMESIKAQALELSEKLAT
jgi:hypothetical protein